MHRAFRFKGVLANSTFAKMQFEFATRSFVEFVVQKKRDLVLIIFAIHIHTFVKYALNF